MVVFHFRHAWYVQPRCRAARWVLLPLALSCGLLLAATQAKATPDYPGALDQALGVRCDNPLSRCLVCHTTALGGRGTAEQPFAITLRELYGFDRADDSAGLREAVTSLQMLDQNADGVSDVDSDGDGVSDVEELANCNNPSGEEYGVPEYGCDGASVVPSASRDFVDWTCVGLVALGWLGRRGARRNQSRVALR